MRLVLILTTACVLAFVAVFATLYQKIAPPSLPATKPTPTTITTPQGWDDYGVRPGVSNAPKATFCGNGANAFHVVFLVDASGSMAVSSNGGESNWDLVRAKMLLSLAHLREVQDFAVLFFQEGAPLDMPAKRLLPANPENRAAAEKFITEVRCRGSGTDPVPALNRAFDLLAEADATRKGKIIFFLTDGDFRDNDAVLKCVRERNKNKDVHIYTYLWRWQGSESIVKLMKQIAQETSGKCKNVLEQAASSPSIP